MKTNIVSQLLLDKGNIVTLSKFAITGGKREMVGSPIVILELPSMFATERVILSSNLQSWSGINDIGELKYLISTSFNSVRKTLLRDIYKANLSSFSKQVKGNDTGDHVTYQYNPEILCQEFPKPTRVEVKPQAKASRPSRTTSK